MQTKTKIICLVLIVGGWVPAAHAIPPPDVLISVWQSALQFLGAMMAIAVSGWFSLRHYLVQYGLNGKRLAWLGIGLTLSLTIVGMWGYGSGLLSTPVQAAVTNTPLPQGELLPIEEVIERETDAYVRQWKQRTLQEMRNEVANARTARHLPMPTLSTIASFTPNAFNALRQTQASNLYVIDTREAYERERFNIEYDAAIRYADLSYGAVPADLPKDKVLVLLCHSGLRGYLAANFVKAAGYQHVAFVQGGLAAWSAADLPVNGDENYSYEHSTFPLLSPSGLNQLKPVLIQLDADNNKIAGLENIKHLPLELATTPEVERMLAQLENKPVALVCRTYGGCFHVQNFAHTLKTRGFNFVGAYDVTGNYLKN